VQVLLAKGMKQRLDQPPSNVPPTSSAKLN
jgi:hypothetical protein